ncbi:MAG: hypothetical protein ACKOC5_00350 [Chloroflexota bacterium]
MIQAGYQGDTQAALQRGWRLWRAWLALAVLNGLLAIASLFAARSAEASLLLGLSAARLVMLGLLLAVTLLFAGLLAETWLRPDAGAARWERLLRRLERRRVWSLLLLAGALGLLTGLLALTALPGQQNSFVRTYLARLLPLALWLSGIGLLTLVGLPALRHGRSLLQARPAGRLFYIMLALFALLFLAWGWTARVVLPVEGPRLGWNVLGVPLIGLQALVAWLAGVGLMLFFTALGSPREDRPRAAWLERLLRPHALDLLLALLIWAAAVLAWQAIPLGPNWFVSEPAAPNSAIYPRSDARVYDVTAQSALVGSGYIYFGNVYVRRALLAMYMTLLHLAGGQEYARVVQLQILVLALLPVMIYFFARSLHNRPAGVTAALLLILREANAIRLSGSITTSNAKLLMADLPATLATMVFMLLAVAWLKGIEQRPRLALAAGGALGMAMLVRVEAMVFLLPGALAALAAVWASRRWGLWWRGGLLLLLGMSLALGPWMVRNYGLTGEVFIDSPYFSMSYLLQRFRPLATESSPPAATRVKPSAGSPAPGDAQLTQPAVTQPAVTPTGQTAADPASTAQSGAPGGHTDLPITPRPTPGLPVQYMQNQSRVAVDYMASNPGLMAQWMLGHIINSNLQALLILPGADQWIDSALLFLAKRSPAQFWQNCCTVDSYVSRLPYWRRWDGRIPIQALAPTVLNLLALAYGVALAWRRHRWAGLAPLMMGETYLVFNGLLRNSGGRYILPVDWLVLAYFSIGLVEASRLLLGYLGGRPLLDRLPGEAPADFQAAGTSGAAAASIPAEPRVWSGFWRSPRTYLLALGLLALACSVPLLEAVIPPRYTVERQESMREQLFAEGRLTAAQRQDLRQFLANGGSLYAGRALYPRYLPAGKGDPIGSAKEGTPRSYPRLVFYIVGMTDMYLMMPVEKKIAQFPHASDILIAVCPSEEVLAVARFDDAGALQAVYWRSHYPQSLTCPLPEKKD